MPPGMGYPPPGIDAGAMGGQPLIGGGTGPGPLPPGQPGMVGIGQDQLTAQPMGPMTPGAVSAAMMGVIDQAQTEHAMMGQQLLAAQLAEAQATVQQMMSVISGEGSTLDGGGMGAPPMLAPPEALDAEMGPIGGGAPPPALGPGGPPPGGGMGGAESLPPELIEALMQGAIG